MNLTYENGTLKSFGEISDASSLINLIADVDITIFGILTLTNGQTKTIQFAKKKGEFGENEYRYWARLNILAHEVTVLNGSTFKLMLVSALFEETSNTVNPIFDVPTINLSIKNIHDYEMAELHKEVAQLTQIVNALKLGSGFDVEIKGDPSYIKPGMIPVAVSGGKFIAAYPFVDMVKEINGETPVDGEIDITAENIPFKTGFVADYLSGLIDTVQAQNKLLESVSSQLSDLREHLNDLDVRFETYKNKGML